MATIDHAQDTLSKRLLNLLYKRADLAKELRPDVVPKSAVRMARCIPIELSVKGIAAQDLLERTLKLVWQQLEQLLLNLTEYLAELETNLSVNFGQARGELVTDNAREATATPLVLIIATRIVKASS